MTNDLTIQELNILEEVRQTYGYQKQLAVAIEELNELSAICSKYFRFDSHEEAMMDPDLRGKILDEVSDVEIVLNHVKCIFELSQAETTRVKKSKVKRIKRWLDNSSSSQYSIKDRSLDI